MVKFWKVWVPYLSSATYWLSNLTQSSSSLLRLKTPHLPNTDNSHPYLVGPLWEVKEIRHVTCSAERPATVNSTLMVPVIIILIKGKHLQHMKDFQGTTCVVRSWTAEPGPKSEAIVQHKEELCLESWKKGQAAFGGGEHPSLRCSGRVEDHLEGMPWRGCILSRRLVWSPFKGSSCSKSQWFSSLRRAFPMWVGPLWFQKPSRIHWVHTYLVLTLAAWDNFQALHLQPQNLTPSPTCSAAA